MSRKTVHSPAEGFDLETPRPDGTNEGFCACCAVNTSERIREALVSLAGDLVIRFQYYRVLSLGLNCRFRPGDLIVGFQHDAASLPEFLGWLAVLGKPLDGSVVGVGHYIHAVSMNSAFEAVLAVN
ncbi:UNVERIFIED_CONTAM: hypothetical protein Slati_3158900 [Sesamum latifolium]|uniref:Uncharacterized protein n=1 Tax=Sesamum latifolium TaxID=2727402 RepID=A0AAW2UV66_9LAMI